MLELKAAPENMEVTGYVRSRTFLNTDVISYREKAGERKVMWIFLHHKTASIYTIDISVNYN